MLIRQIFRDLRRDWLQFLSVFLMSFLCLLVYSALISLSTGMDNQANRFFKKSNLADAVITADAIQTNQLNDITNISKVSAVEPRFVTTGELIIKNKQKMALTLTATNHGVLSQPVVTKGAAYMSQEGIWLNREFVEAHNLPLKDSVTITIAERKVTVPLVGVIQQPEYLFFPESADYPFPNYQKTAYAFISTSYLSRLMGFPIESNQLSLKHQLSDQSWLEFKSKEIFDEQYRQISETRKHPQVAEFLNKQQQIEKLALLFPLLFITLSGLTMASTMTRFIKKEQVVIGTYKAMGLKNSKIYQHYLSFGILISGAGSLLGIAFGPTLVAPLLISFLKEQYGIPAWETVFDFKIVIVTLLLVICCMVTTYFPARQILKQNPANTLQIQRSTQLKPGLIEKSSLLNRLSFTNHWVARSILRNKGRTLMGVFGALGCTVLLVAGIGINRSIRYTVDETFNETNQYEERIVFEHPLSTSEQKSLTATLKFKDIQWLQQESIDVINAGTTKEGSLSIIENKPLLKLVTTKQEKLNLTSLNKNEVFITNKLARTLQVQPGDALYVKLKSDTQYQPLIVKDIVAISSPQGVITTKKVWQNLGYTYQPTSLLNKNKLTTSFKKTVTDYSFVKNTRLNHTDYQETLNMIQATVIVVSLVVFAAIFLGVVILSNFNLLIFAERFREFATLKVLGFTQKEIRRLSMRENLILTTVGVAIGFIGGHYFLKAYVGIISPENQEYLLQFGWQEYLLVSVLAIGCSLIINLFLDIKIRRIAMAESLKSNE